MTNPFQDIQREAQRQRAQVTRQSEEARRRAQARQQDTPAQARTREPAKVDTKERLD